MTNNGNLYRRKKMRKKSIRNSRRRQQVYRQLTVLMLLIIIIVIGIISCTSRLLSKRSQEVAKVDKKQEQKKEKEKEDKETAGERLSRVREEAKAGGYPDEVIELLSKNIETLDFVEHYGEKKDVPPAETIDELVKGEIPHLLQWDERWGYASYGTSIMAVSGCGPTCMSMVVSGLTGDKSITPVVVAAYSEEQGYLDEENNTYWQFMREASSNWGVTCRELSTDEEEVSRVLAAGHPIICSMGPGDFTRYGHFIVLTDYEDGKITLRDPFSLERSEKKWTLDEFAGQVKAMWTYSYD